MDAPDLVTYRGTVYPWHCDHVGHMNVMWYVGKFDEATWNLLARLGLTSTYLREQRRGMVAVDQHLQYRRELLAGDVLTVRSQVLELHARKIRFRHRMFAGDDADAAAVTTLVGVHIDADSRTACPFPESVFERARDWVVAAESAAESAG